MKRIIIAVLFASLAGCTNLRLAWVTATWPNKKVCEITHADYSRDALAAEQRGDWHTAVTKWNGAYRWAPTRGVRP